MASVTCGLTAEDWDQLRHPTLLLSMGPLSLIWSSRWSVCVLVSLSGYLSVCVIIGWQPRQVHVIIITTAAAGCSAFINQLTHQLNYITARRQQLFRIDLQAQTHARPTERSCSMLHAHTSLWHSCNTHTWHAVKTMSHSTQITVRSPSYSDDELNTASAAAAEYAAWNSCETSSIVTSFWATLSYTWHSQTS